MEYLYIGIYILLAITWFFFPVAMILATYLPKTKEKKNLRASYFRPSVSVIIAAYNEENSILKKIINTLELDYPKYLLEIIVVSDGSSDQTASIAKSVPNVTVIDLDTNQGRAFAHNAAAKIAIGDIFLFTDAETLLAKNYLKIVINALADPSYGSGAGVYSFMYDDIYGKSEASYWRIESMMRIGESRLGLLPFASGGCLVIRRELFKKIPISSDIDNILPLESIVKGKKVFCAEDAFAYDQAVDGADNHFKKRTRISLRSFGDLLLYLPKLISCNKYKILLVLFFHRVNRWLSGYYLGLLTILFIIMYSSQLSEPRVWLFLSFLPIIILYFLAFLGLMAHVMRLPTSGFFVARCMQAYSLILSFVAFSVAIAKYLQGERIKSYVK